MKKMLLLLALVFNFISCSPLGATLRAFDNYLEKKSLKEQRAKERESKAISQFTIIFRNDPEKFHYSSIKAFYYIENEVEYNKKIRNIADHIVRFPYVSFLSNNTRVLLEAIKYLGEKKTEVLYERTFGFKNTDSVEENDVLESEVEELAKKYKFAYSIVTE